jgi:hypothetical protein
MGENRGICENGDFIEKLHPVDRFAWSERWLSAVQMIIDLHPWSRMYS